MMPAQAWRLSTIKSRGVFADTSILLPFKENNDIHHVILSARQAIGLCIQLVRYSSRREGAYILDAKYEERRLLAQAAVDVRAALKHAIPGVA